MPPFVFLGIVSIMKSTIDTIINKGVKTDISIERVGDDKTLAIKTEQDVAPVLQSNQFMRDNARTDSERGRGRVIADVPMVIYHDWKERYGFDLLSPQNSNWGMGMTKQEHQKFARRLFEANPALKCVDERL